MVTDDTKDAGGPDRLRLALIGCCVLAIVLAASLVPALATGDLAGTPIDSVLPGERFDDASAQAAAGTGGTSGFGALNPGDSTGVGGDTGLDKDTFASNDTEVHFTVESSESAYWRTGAYATYTGTGWERDGDETPYVSPLNYDGLLGERVQFEVTLDRAATGLPTVWRPRAVGGVDELLVTDARSFRSERPIEEGTTFSGVSRLPEDSVDVLRSAGQQYPDEIETRYTQLPEDTPARVGEFTEELTADASTPYDAATTVQNWLRSSKGYSLNASRQSDHIADTFIFEMEAGYCEYFATAMTTMLRSQGIPARYTVGYSTGQPVGDNTYEVRGMNAHAWVEVYFPEVGWVKFDPTPGDSRLQTQEQILESELGGEFDLQEQGSPGEVFEPGQIREQTNQTDQPGDNDTENRGGYDISLNRTAVPGLPVEVTVTYDEEPVADATVYFNGQPVGTTDGEGVVVATVPDDEELRVSIEAPPDRTEGTADDIGMQVDQPRQSAGTTLTGEQTFFGPVRDRSAGATVAVHEGANETYPIETGASVTVSGDVLPGETVTVTATVQDVAIPEATVYLDGEQVATTDGAGRAEITLPAEPGNVSVVVERSSVAGRTELTIPDLELSVDTGTIPFPFTTATVEVTAGEQRVAGAPITVDGEDVAVTGPDGTADVRLPLSISATIETARYGLADSKTVDGLARNFGLALVAVTVLIALPLFAVYRRGYRPLDVLAWFGDSVGGVRGLVRYCTLALVTVARRGDVWLAIAVARARTTIGYAVRVLRGRIEPARLRAALATWLREKYEQLREFSRRLRETVAGEQESPAAVDPPVASGDDHGVREAWERLLARLSATSPETMTPGELAAHAVERDGLPAEPVRTLRDAFREVEYGSSPPADRLDRVRGALERIDRADDRTPSGTDGDGPGSVPHRERSGRPGRDDPRERATADGGTTPIAGRTERSDDSGDPAEGVN